MLGWPEPSFATAEPATAAEHILGWRPFRGITGAVEAMQVADSQEYQKQYLDHQMVEQSFCPHLGYMHLSSTLPLVTQACHIWLAF